MVKCIATYRDNVDIDPLQGRVIDGRYELLERIGEGSMGAVYRARQRVVDRLVAVKLLHGEAADEGEFRTRFEREAKALGRFDHPGCVRVYDFGWFADVDAPFLVSEFIEGEPLYDRLAHTMSPLERIGYVREIADAMAHAHSHGIIHRDLKPENILVTPAGRIKVVDFGLARMTADEEIRLTQAGDAHGTPAYMSPEQCRGDAELTPACDVYALGCVLFELFERRLPFTASTASGVMIKHVTDPIPRQANAATPPAVKELIVEMMQKDPSARPTMPEVAARLDEVIERLAPGEGPLDPTPPLTDASPASIADTLPRAAQPDDAEDPEDAEDPLRVTTWLQDDDDDVLVERASRPRFLAAGIAVLVVFALLGFLIFTGLFQSAEPPADEASLPGPDEPPMAVVAPENATPPEALAPTEGAGSGAPTGDDEPNVVDAAQVAQAADEVSASPSPQEAAPEPEQKKAAPAPANEPQGETQAEKDEREAAEKRRRSVKLRY